VFEMRQFHRLADEPLTSRDGRHVLWYADGGIATLTDTHTGEIRWADLQTLAGELDVDWEHTAVAAFRIGRHTLLVEDNGGEARDRPELSVGTFAVTCYMSVNADSSFKVFRDGAVVADHTWDNGGPEPTTPEVTGAGRDGRRRRHGGGLRARPGAALPHRRRPCDRGGRHRDVRLRRRRRGMKTIVGPLYGERRRWRWPRWN
jgi:hypothetical protein